MWQEVREREGRGQNQTGVGGQVRVQNPASWFTPQIEHWKFWMQERLVQSLDTIPGVYNMKISVIKI